MLEVAWLDADGRRTGPLIAQGRLGAWIDESSGEEVVLGVAGEIDTLTVADFASDLIGACLRADRQQVVVDLAGVDFLGTAGLRVLLELWRLCRRWGLEFAVRDPNPAALRLIELGGFGIPLRPSEGDSRGRSLRGV